MASRSPGGPGGNDRRAGQAGGNDHRRAGRSRSMIQPLVVAEPRDLQVVINTRISERLSFLEPELQATNSRIDMVETICQANMDRLEALSRTQISDGANNGR